MAPTLKDGQLVCARKTSKANTPKIGSIVVVKHPTYGQIIKRVVAKQGQTFLLAGDGEQSTASVDIGPVEPHLITSICLC